MRITGILSALFLCAGALLLAGSDKTRAAAPPVPPIRPASPLETLLSGDVAAYTWSEGAAGQNSNHNGIILFYRSRGEVYGRAWPLKSNNNWPAVRGVGALKGDDVHIVFRSAAPGHDFYHADCHFSFSADGRTFVCTAMQKAQAGDENPMVPCVANGELIEKLNSSMAGHIEKLRLMARGAAPDKEPATEARERCPVLKNAASDRISAAHGGKTYHFCCESCRNVFLGNPQAFGGK